MSETRLGYLDCTTAVRFSKEFQLSLANTENTKRPEFYVELVLTTHISVISEAITCCLEGYALFLRRNTHGRPRTSQR